MKVREVLRLIAVVQLLCCSIIYPESAPTEPIGYSPLHHIPGKPCEVWMTIFVHGAVKGQYACWDLLRVWFDKIENTTYEKVVSIIREDCFFWKNHAMQGLGLRKITLQSQENSDARVIANMFHTVSQQYQKDPAINYYYTFGWSGLLSIKTRYQEACIFYPSIIEEALKLKEQFGVMPRLRIMAFSHGGNLVLNLAKAKQDRPQLACLPVDELIFVGVPIQKETDFLIADDMFKKVYHFYSIADNIQTADFFSFKRFFSNRKFHSRSDFKVPNKVVQISIKVHGYALRNRYAQQEQLKHPIIDNYPDHKIKTIKTAPGHIELWYLGWTPAWYRKDFPFYPLPLCVVVPTILNAISNNGALKNNLEVCLHPQKEFMQIRNRRKPYKETIPFLETSVLESLKKDAESVKPPPRFYLDHRLRINAALLASKGDILKTEVKEEEKSKKKKKKRRRNKKHENKEQYA